MIPVGFLSNNFSELLCFNSSQISGNEFVKFLLSFFSIIYYFLYLSSKYFFVNFFFHGRELPFILVTSLGHLRWYSGKESACQ